MNRFIIAFLISIAGTIQSFGQEVFWAKEILECSENFSGFGPNTPSQILGKYSVMPDFGKSSSAFSLAPNLKRNQYIVLKFDCKRPANQLIIAENYNPGAISKITVFSQNNSPQVIFENVNPLPTNEGGRFSNIFQGLSSFIIEKIRIDFNTSNFVDECQIDAVGISPSSVKFSPKINFSSEAKFPFQPENLRNINSNFSELAPIISSDGRKLFFTREGHPDNLGLNRHQDVWIAESRNGLDFDSPVNLGPPINNIHNNFAISVTPDNNVLLLGNAYRRDLPPIPGLSISRFDGTNWSFPEQIIIPELAPKSKQNSYSLGNDGKTLLLSIVNDDSYGEHDIFVSFRQADGSWSAPRNLGPDLNTASNEESPFLASDGRTLYFSGNGYPGLGRNDIFMTRRQDDSWTHWTEPVNLGDKINSIHWDAYFSVTASGDYAYFVSSTQKPFSEDIYRIELPKSVQPGSVVLVYGKVFNQKDKNPVAATIIYEELPSGKEIGIAHSNPLTGDYKITLPAGKRYGFLAKSEGFTAINENLDLTVLDNYKEISKDLILVPLERGVTVKLNNLLFETGKFEILEESFPELNRLAQLLRENPNLKIRIEGHTDDVGSNAENLILSENRAKSTVEYLASAGINRKRLTFRGMGETRPVASNDTELGRSQNRRVEFIILKK